MIQGVPKMYDYIFVCIFLVHLQWHGLLTLFALQVFTISWKLYEVWLRTVQFVQWPYQGNSLGVQQVIIVRRSVRHWVFLYYNKRQGKELHYTLLVTSNIELPVNKFLATFLLNTIDHFY